MILKSHFFVSWTYAVDWLVSLWIRALTRLWSESMLAPLTDHTLGCLMHGVYHRNIVYLASVCSIWVITCLKMNSGVREINASDNRTLLIGVHWDTQYLAFPRIAKPTPAWCFVDASYIRCHTDAGMATVCNLHN